ncbi:MAG: WG repeat-containing protein, partial [Clostridia bacterium]|nr:WG repeat-containing protein [Clostridia bacterium]
MRKFIFKALALSLALLMLLPAFAACAPESSDPVNTTVDGGSNKDPNTTTRPQDGENVTNSSGSNNTPSTPNVPDGKYKVESIGTFSEGLAVITTDKGYGYMNTRGEVVIAPKYSYACDFKDGWARVTDNSGKNGYIDKSGNYVIEPKYDYVSDTFDKIAQVQIDGVDKYINRNGDILYTVTGQESGRGAISNGYFWVETKEETLS